ncbi:MAG: amino acid ABC transporter substrate-binding protein, partial [Candidatus Electrothrix sp. AR1]|nr:amino acid ABC transporter substrate-binding protein [Candidatus Electrothrix sp. AR1]
MTIRKIISRHRRFFFWEVLLIIVALGSLATLQLANNTLYIAAVLPDQSPDHKTMLIALKIYAERVNKYGGVNGDRLKIQEYYDDGNSEKARKIAKEIVADNRFFATVGHFNKETTQAAANIYTQAGMPLLAPISNLSKGKGSVFQLTPTPESYGVYTAHYIKEILDKNHIIIIHDTYQDHIDLIDSFTKTFADIGGTVKRKTKLKELKKPNSDVQQSDPDID